MMEQMGYEFAWGAIKAVFFALCLVSLLITGLNATTRYFRIGYDETDNKITGKRSGLKIYTDHATGCQYVGTSSGNIIPRVDGDGQICKGDAL